MARADAAARHRADAAEKDLKITLGPMPADGAVVVGNEQRLCQALSELVSNALAVTPPGGSLSLGMVTAVIDGTEWLQMVVSDTGPGIPLQEQSVQSAPGAGSEFRLWLRASPPAGYF